MTIKSYGGYATLGANTFTGDQTIVSTDAGATVGPLLDLFRNSASPAANDIIGGVTYTGKSSTGVTRTYASEQATIVSATNGAEAGSYTIRTMRAGTLTDALIVSPVGRIQGGGTSSSFPAFVPNGANWDAIKADDSDFAGIRMAAATLSDNLSFTAAAKGTILKQGANGRVGTFVANGTTPVVVSNTGVAITDNIVISLNAVGGTGPTIQPVIATITASTGFTVVAAVGDTSTYNYAITKSAA